MVGRLLKERSSLTSQKFSLASCLMCACKKGHVKVVELLVQEEAVLLDIKNKNGLKPEEVTQESAIRELLREEHWRRARSEVWNPKGFKRDFYLFSVRWAGRQNFWSNRNEMKLRSVKVFHLWFYVKNFSLRLSSIKFLEI